MQLVFVVSALCVNSDLRPRRGLSSFLRS